MPCPPLGEVLVDSTRARGLGEALVGWLVKGETNVEPWCGMQVVEDGGGSGWMDLGLTVFTVSWCCFSESLVLVRCRNLDLSTPPQTRVQPQQSPSIANTPRLPASACLACHLHCLHLLHLFLRTATPALSQHLALLI